MLAPVSVHADYFRQGIGSTMIKMGIEKVKAMGYKGITIVLFTANVSCIIDIICIYRSLY